MICITNAFFCGCCPHKEDHYSKPTFILLHQGSIVVDSILKKDTAYYMFYTLICNSDTISQFKYTNLLAPGQQFKAQFVPYSAYNKYCSDYSSSFGVTPMIMKWEHPSEYMSFETSISPIVDYMSWITVVSDKRVDFELVETTNAPNKIYYPYDWKSKVHYDYMRYNADSAILTFSIENIELDELHYSIDSVLILFPTSPIISRGYNQLPLEIKDTISIIDDVTYSYEIYGFMKGQKCGGDTCYIRVHKNEIISKQDESHHHQGQIYEYDE